jgi:modulator of FtsH protease HflK
VSTSLDLRGALSRAQALLLGLRSRSPEGGLRAEAFLQSLPLRTLAPSIGALLLLGWLATGVMAVDTGQVALVYRFGAIVRTAAAGLRLRLPYPIEGDERLNLTEVRRVEPGSKRILTGDHNLVQLTVVTQYTVADPVAFTTCASDAEGLVAGETEAAAAAAAAGMNVDDLLTTGRGELQREVLQNGQAALDRLGTGVRLVSVEVRELVPPAAVVDAFNDVSSARGDQETLSLAAEAYSSKVLPDVRGQSALRLEQAKAEASTTLARARGDVARIQSLRAAWEADPKATRDDLRTEALRAIGPKVDVIVAPVGTEVTVKATR